MLLYNNSYGGSHARERENAGTSRESSILLLPECLESSGVKFSWGEVLLVGEGWREFEKVEYVVLVRSASM